MHTAGFWIAQHPSADQIVLDAQQIKIFNDNVRDHLKLTKDIFYLINHFKNESLLEIFKRTIQQYSDKNYFLADGSLKDDNFIDKVRKNMHLNGVVLGMEPRYVIVISYA